MLVSLYLAIQLARALDVTAEWALQKYYRYIKSRAQAAAVFFATEVVVFRLLLLWESPTPADLPLKIPRPRPLNQK